MRKDDNDWEIVVDETNTPETDYDGNCVVKINTVKYVVSRNTACLSHAILLLVDAINDKSI